jgi:hypothetical protein
MKNKKKYDKKDLWDFVWRFTLSIIVAVIFIRVLIYPELVKMEDYRERLNTSHRIAKGRINSVIHRKVLIYYDFIVNGVKFSGKSRYSHLNPPYPQEGDSIDVYYDEKDPNINLWSREFYE